MPARYPLKGQGDGSRWRPDRDEPLGTPEGGVAIYGPKPAGMDVRALDPVVDAGGAQV